MRGGPRITPAQIEFDADGVPHAPAFGDRYHPRIGAAAQAQHVFLAGNQLPARWAAHERFTLLETGFGLGNNFLATWDAWRQDPQRCARLHYVAIDAHPPSRDDLRRCHAASPWPALAAALQRAWPPLTPGLHPIGFDDDRVQLLLAFGDARRMLRELDLMADAFYLDGFAPDRNPALWRAELMTALARKAAPGATAATWSVAREVRQGLQAAGFEVQRCPGIGGKREVTQARFAPHPGLRRPAGRPAPPADPADRHALVIGAGLAGAWAAYALTQQGWTACVFDRHALPAQETSGNPAGLFHGSVMADDGPHAGFNRAAALTAAQTMAPWFDTGAVTGAVDGLLRLARVDEGLTLLQARAAASGLPPDYVQLLDAAAASAAAGTGVDRPAWLFRQGGWVAPGALVNHLLRRPGIDFRGGCAIGGLRRAGGVWVLHDDAGRDVARGSTVVLANGAGVLQLRPAAGWPLGLSRGQLSWWREPPAGAPSPRLPLAGTGYALRLPDGSLLCGASAAAGDPEPALRASDHGFNLDRLAQLTGWRAPAGTAPEGRVGWRVQVPDRLPIVGPVAVAGDAATRAAEVRREPGLFVLGALGSRGLTWGALAGQTLAAWVSGAPMPLEARLRDAIDPARWSWRAARRR